MKTSVAFNPLLQSEYGAPESVVVEGTTVGDCLQDLVRQVPEARNWFAEKSAVVRVIVSLNNRQVINLDGEGLRTALNPGDTLQVLALVAGG